MGTTHGVTAVVPSAGLGTRLRPHTFTVPKVLLPVAGKPILGHILDRLEREGVRRVVVIIGYLGEKIEEYVRGRYRFETVFVEQKEFSGLGYAVSLAAPHVAGPALVVLGDTIVEGGPSEGSGSDFSWIGVKRVADPERFGVVVENRDGWIERLVEKPETFVSDRAIVGVYYLRRSGLLFDALAENIRDGRRTRGEFQLTDALQTMVERGERIRAVPVERWYDCGKVETLLETNRRLLDANASPARAIPSVVFNGPVHVGDRVSLSNCVIGPHVSIGGGVTMENVIIRDSIVNDEADIRNAVLVGSVIGHGAVLRGYQEKISLGDASEMTFDPGPSSGK